MSKLDEALRSLREDVKGDSPDAERTLANILQARHARPSRMRIRLITLLAATFVLVGSVAWAAFARIQHARHQRTPSAESPALGRAPAGPAPSSSTPVPNGSEPLAMRPEPTLAFAPPPSVPSAPAGTGPGAFPSSSAPTSVKSAASAELEAYEKGHRAHFDDHNPALALKLWDDFLSRFPTSRWQPEVRYNRALCLIRLHRTEEARHALEPFARGYGGYRQGEATALLAALNDAGP